MKLVKIAAFLHLSLVFSFLCVAQETRQEETRNEKVEASQLVGDWVFEIGVRNGDEVDSANLGTVSITEKEFSIPVPGTDPFVMAFTIDNEHSPAHIDIEITSGPAPPSKSQGIIAIEDGKIKLCYHPADGTRPESFESTSENGFHYFLIAKDAAVLSTDDLKGTWSIVSGSRGGEEISAERLPPHVIFSEETVTMPAGDDVEFVMSYKLDTEQTPAAIDLEITEGPQQNAKAKGIIKIDGDELVFCYDSTDKKRPESFESTEDNGFFLFRMKVKE